MSDMQIWNYGNRQVRTVEINGEYWFVAKDVFEALEISWRWNESVANISERMKLKTTTTLVPTEGEEIPTGTWVLNEAGLYKTAFRSNKPEAERFTNWVAEEVLPSIHRTGKYEAPAISTVELNKILVRWLS